MTFQTLLSDLNIVLTIALVVGGIFAFRKGYSKEVGERQAQLIDTLKDEVGVLHGKVDDLEKERSTQDRVIATIRYLLKQYGLRIVISGDVVTCSDTSGKSKSTRIQDRAPIKPISGDDDDTDAG